MCCSSCFCFVCCRKSTSTSIYVPLPSESEQWVDYLNQSKKAFYGRYKRNVGSKKSINDFELGHTIGKGAFGTVIVAKDVEQEKYFAIKVIEKSKIYRGDNMRLILTEEKLLTAIRFPFIVNMEYNFKDRSYIFFVMPYVLGGELFTVLRKKGRFPEKMSIFYATQVVLALEFLHYLDVIYRDLKPENLLIDAEGYLKITDLGFAKIVRKRTYTFCGTPDYIAPEIVLSRGYSRSVDWWALGVLLFEMCSGSPPFESTDIAGTYELIVSGTYRCPTYFSCSLKDILEKLLQVDITRRLGCMSGGVSDIKDHGWFKDIHWFDILNRRLRAPYIPKVRSLGDTSNFNFYEDLVFNEYDRDSSDHNL